MTTRPPSTLPALRPARKLTEAQRRQRAQYAAEMATPKHAGERRGEAFALHAATGLRVTR